MARTQVASLTLPSPPEVYSAQDQRELRRSLEETIAKLSAAALAPGTPTVRNWGTVTTATTIDLSTADDHIITLGANVALTFTVTTVKPDRLFARLFILQDSVGSRLVSAWTNVTHLSGTAPTLTTTAAGLDLVEFVFLKNTTTPASSTWLLISQGRKITSDVVGNLTGNASTATALETARNINGVSFNGTASITVTADASTLTGSTLASGVTASSLQSLTMARSGGASVTLVSATPTTIFTLPGTANATWEVNVRMGAAGAVNSAWAIIACGAGATTFAVTTSAIGGAVTAITVDNSGNVQVTQSAASQNGTGSYVRTQ